ncbi:MAG: YbhB/YbcL family Raf kinase inhibitor-like protein [Patescibacteria group bacterium]
MQISSSAFGNNGLIPAQYTCDGQNINPPLGFSDIPSNAKSLVLLMDDPDVPKSVREDGMWDHWVVYNIPPATVTIFEAQNPPGLMGVNTGGRLAYGGPCPPDKEHRYFFKLYALDSMLELAEGATRAEVENAMEGHIIAQAELMGRYDRNR